MCCDNSMCVSPVIHKQPVPIDLTMHAGIGSSDTEQNKWVYKIYGMDG